MTIRYQRIATPEATHSNFVKEFRDAGHLFGWDNPLTPKDRAEDFELVISENSTRTHCFEPHTGRLNMTGPTLCALPLNAIVDFGVALHLKLDLSTDYVLRWPDKIETSLEKLGTKHMQSDTVLEEREMEKEDRDFFTRYGHPKISKYKGRPAPYFLNSCCYYSVGLQVFTPDTARWSSRIYDYFKEDD